MTRIAVGGFLHETNTFAPTKAVYDAFVLGGGWPPMSQGANLIERMRGINVGIAGFVPAAEALRVLRHRADLGASIFPDACIVRCATVSD